MTAFAFGLCSTLVAAKEIRIDQLDLRCVDCFLAHSMSPSPAPGVSAAGGPIVIAGKKYEHGLSTQGITRVVIDLDGDATALSAEVGVVDNSKQAGPVWFEAIGDGRMLWEGSTMKRGDASYSVKIPLSGIRRLTLLVQSPDQMEVSSAWAAAVITYEGAAPASMPAPQVEPYILTPKAPLQPRINGARVFGVRPGNPVLYTVAATGARPMTFTAEGLPPGLSLDSKCGMLRGTVPHVGEYEVQITARNAHGSATRALRLVVGPKIALTPPMGWNSWNCFAQDVHASDIRAAAEAMVATGLVNHGWSYINTDDFWAARPTADAAIFHDMRSRAATKKMAPPRVQQISDTESLTGPLRDTAGNINPNSRFPDMKGMVNHIHGLGLKAGIYSSPGPLTCWYNGASYGYEEADARRFAEWGFDYFKYDWCTYRFYNLDNSVEELKQPYELMGRHLSGQKRDIVYSLCQYGLGEVWKWGDSAYGNLWRTTNDILDVWPSMAGIGFAQSDHAAYAGPGHWNDPDMLVVGKVGWGRQLHATRLGPDEQYTHVSLWALLAAPLLLGCDLTALDEFTLNLLTNDEVIAIDQDELGRPASRIHRDRNLEIWRRPLADGSMAVGLFNRGELTAPILATWAQLGLAGDQVVRDVWRQQDQGIFAASFSAEVPGHGVVLLRIEPVATRAAKQP